MDGKSLTGSALMAVFSGAAYALYVSALIQGKTDWIYIAAFVYFLPIIIEAAEDLQSTRIAPKWLFILFAVCFCIGLVYLGFLWYFISLLKEEPSALADHRWLTVLLAAMPIALLPQKVYPFIAALMQLYNRSRGVRRR